MNTFTFTARRSIGFSIEADSEEEAREMAASTEADFNWNEECVYSEINMDVSDRNQERASSPRDDQMYAYAIGYYAGRAEGVENNPYAPDDPLRPLYTRGYDCGVTDYCHEAHPEE